MLWILALFVSCCLAIQFKEPISPIVGTFMRSQAGMSVVSQNHGSLGFYVIAMEDRKEYATSILEQIGLQNSTRVVDAIDRNSFNEANLVKSGQLQRGFSKKLWDFRRKGIIACALSHQKALKMFLKDKTLTHAVVFEDDIILQEGIRERIAKAQGKDQGKINILQYIHDLAKSSSKEPKWDGINLGICSPYCGDTMAMLPGGIKLIQAPQPYCTHAYMYTRRAAEIELEANVPIHQSEDKIRVDLVNDGSFKYFSTVPRIFDQNPNDEVTGAKSIHGKSDLDIPEC
eukprot:jgi/Bigna1/67145/fgenesh1_pg.3_\